MRPKLLLERDTHRAVDVDVQHGHVFLVRAELEDPFPEPAHVFQQQAAIRSKLRLHVVDKAVGQHVRALQYHFVHVVVAVVAGLREDGDRPVRDLRAVFLRSDLRHIILCFALAARVQQRLRDAVADRRVQSLRPLAGSVCLSASSASFLKLVTSAPIKHWRDMLLDHGDEVPCEEQRVAPARARVLHGCAVAVSHLPVVQHEQH